MKLILKNDYFKANYLSEMKKIRDKAEKEFKKEREYAIRVYFDRKEKPKKDYRYFIEDLNIKENEFEKRLDDLFNKAKKEFKSMKKSDKDYKVALDEYNKIEKLYHDAYKEINKWSYAAASYARSA